MGFQIVFRRVVMVFALAALCVLIVPSGPALAAQPAKPIAQPAKPIAKPTEPAKPAAPATPKAPIRHEAGVTAIPDSYLIVFKKSTAVEATSKGLTKSLGGKVVRTFGHVMRGFEFAGNAAQAKRMAADPRVAYVEQNHRFRASETQAPTPSWGLDRIDQHSDVLDNSYTYQSGAGNVRAYVIDTGIRVTHNDFEGRAISGFDAIDGGTADDCHGHGTHVAGTIGSASYGVAKAVTLVAVRVLDCDGNGTTATVVAGLDWVTADHAAGVPAVANMSLGGDADQVIDDAVAGSIADGISYAVAAGNEDDDACTRSPARAPAAITVGATGGFFGENDDRAYFSDYGTCVDIFAPGVEISSAYNSSDTATESFSGTSMASPHVAGAAALILSEHPSYSPAQVRDALVAAATIDAVQDPGVGSPNALLFVDNTPPANDFSVTVSPTAVAVDPGTSVTATVRTATTAGVSQSVRLSITRLPDGVTASFTPASVTSGGTSTLRITSATSGQLGSYPLNIVGTGSLASVMRSAQFQLTVNGPPGCVVSSSSDLEIPDTSSVESTIPIHGCAGQASAASAVHVQIVHTFRGDLGVSLVAPDGTEYPLFDHSGGSLDDLDLTSTLDLSSEVANGAWRLRVEDSYYSDTGYLDSWTLNLADPPATPGCTGSNPSDVLIPDPGTATSAVIISGCARNGTAASTVAVKIVHPFVGDLDITLVAPDGSSYQLRSQTGDSADDIDETYSVNLSSEPANGVWRLRVDDVGPFDNGYLDTWTLNL